jgi:shikimate kinase
MPGAGKSTVGVVLAKKLGYTFLDSDLLIQEREQMLLHEIISDKGLDIFEQIENEVNASIKTNRSVIATGGSVIYGTEAMMHLKSIGSIVYLKLDYNELCERLGDLEERGVAIRTGQTFSDLYDERTPLYKKYADITVDCCNKSIREIVLEIYKQFPI